MQFDTYYLACTSDSFCSRQLNNTTTSQSGFDVYISTFSYSEICSPNVEKQSIHNYACVLYQDRSRNNKHKRSVVMCTRRNKLQVLTSTSSLQDENTAMILRPQKMLHGERERERANKKLPQNTANCPTSGYNSLRYTV